MPRNRSVKLGTCVEAAAIAEEVTDEGGGSGRCAVAQCGVESRCSAAVVVNALIVARNADVRRRMVSAGRYAGCQVTLQERGVFPRRHAYDAAILSGWVE